MQNKSYRHRGLHDHDTGYSSRNLAKPPHVSLQGLQCPSAASSMLHLKHSQVVPRFFASDGPGVGSSSLTQLMGLMGFSWFLGFALPLPDIKRKPSIFCWPVTLIFYVVSLHVLRNQPGNRRVGNLAAVRLLWSIIFQRRVEHSCGQTSRRNTCYTTAILLCLVSFDHTFGQWIHH